MRKLSKTKAEKAHEKWLIAKEAVALWFYRWSQVMFWTGIILVVVEMALIIADTFVEIFTFAEWQKTVLYIVGTVGAVMFVFGERVDRKIQILDERGKKRRGTDE